MTEKNQVSFSNVTAIIENKFQLGTCGSVDRSYIHCSTALDTRFWLYEILFYNLLKSPCCDVRLLLLKLLYVASRKLKLKFSRLNRYIYPAQLISENLTNFSIILINPLKDKIKVPKVYNP